MAIIHPFRGLRPVEHLAMKVASLPYDVLNKDEASRIVKENPLSFLRVVKSEVLGGDPYQAGKDAFNKMISDGVLLKDDDPSFYIYKEETTGHEQYGLVATFSVEEYLQRKIKEHETTRKDKEDDRFKHIDATNANTGPAFLFYQGHSDIDLFIKDFIKNNKPKVDFTSFNIRNTLWQISDAKDIKILVDMFSKIDNLYIADGHHRSAAAARIYQDRKSKGTLTKEASYFMAVIFPGDQLKIMDYNRLVLDWKGVDPNTFLDRLQDKFILGDSYASPKRPKEFGLFFNGKWIQIKAKDNSYPNDEIGRLDCSILQNNLLGPIFNVTDPRIDANLDFVGGIRGMSELEKRVNSGSAVLAISMFPTSIYDLQAVADQNKYMPPKSTWFEPKLLSGLVVHLLD